MESPDLFGSNLEKVKMLNKGDIDAKVNTKNRYPTAVSTRYDPKVDRLIREVLQKANMLK